VCRTPIPLRALAGQAVWVVGPGSPIDDSCLICREHGGLIEVPGGLLEDGEALTFHCPPMGDGAYAGHLLVTSRRHAPDFAALDPAEAGAIGLAISKYSGGLKSLGATHVYVATIGHHVDHLHVHLLPRWPETPSEVAWHAVDDWPGARRLDAAGIVTLIANLTSAIDDGSPPSSPPAAAP